MAPFRGYFNESFWGFGFNLHRGYTSLGIILDAWITEPNGTTVSGGLWYGPFNDSQPAPTHWLTPDLQAGITTNWTSGNTSLLVEG